MNVQLNSISDTRKSLVISLDPSEVAAELQEVVREFSKLARLPGFRPGKAPAAMVQRRFQKEIGEEFQQKIFSKAYRGALEQHKLDVLNVVKVDPEKVDPAAAATVTVTVDVRPEFALPEYTGLPTEVASTEAGDDEVNAVVENLRAERAEFKAVERPAQKGDYVKLSYEGTVAGRPVAELVPDKQIYNQVPQTWEEVEGEHDGVIPGLGRHLAGLKAGDKKTVDITFAADFEAAPALAGKTAAYALEIQEVRERTLPALDEAFFKAHQVEDLAGLQDMVRDNLKLQKEYQNREEQRRQVTEALAAKVEFTLPESLVEDEIQNVLRRFIEENMRRGVPQEQFEKDKEQLVESARKAATRRVKLQLMLARVAEQEKLKVEEQDISQYIRQEAARTRQNPATLAKELGKNQNALRSVQQAVIFDKAVDFLVSKATVSHKQPKA